MRTRIDSVALVGTTRTVAFKPGLNIVTGPISTGKTTLIALLPILLGQRVGDYPREVDEHVRAIAGPLVLGEERFSIVRPFVQTPSAKVDIAGDHETLKLPAMTADKTSPLTYGDWLLGKLGLPRIEVPSAPTKPDSDPTPLSINDYMLYCSLPQDEIDSEVFGHKNPFRNIKRRYVFEVLYGGFSVRAAALTAELRQITAQLRVLRDEATAGARFLAGTELDNRAALDRQLAEAEERIIALEAADTAGATSAPPRPETIELRTRVRNAETELVALEKGRDAEALGVEDLRRLLAQLETQNARLTRSVATQQLLVDFEFQLCPRCGASVDDARGSAEQCMLCLQPPGSTVTSEDLLREQQRIAAQIDETRDLVSTREESLRARDTQITQARALRADLGHQLDLALASYVSDQASALTQRATERAELRSAIQKLSEYRRLYARYDATAGEIALLEQRRGDLQQQLLSERVRHADAEARIKHVEREFGRIIETFGTPRFGETHSAAIDRRTFLPILDGRPFDELSSQGLNVLVNVAYALAHQETAIALDLALPNILFIDGLTSNVGHEGIDMDRIHAVYRYLIALSKKHGDRLQIIVADNDVPEEARDYVRLSLTDGEKLVPISPPAA